MIMNINKNNVKARSIQSRSGLLFFFLFLSFTTVYAQITVYPIQDFNFGTFSQGNTGGMVEISTAGIRTSTGDVILVNSGSIVSQAIFEVEAPEGIIISLTNGPDVTLSGSNGGSMTLRLNQTDPVSPFNTIAVPPDRTRIHLSGSLIVGDRTMSPPGSYQGTFSITFHQE